MRRLLAGFALAVMVLAGCGDDGGGELRGYTREPVPTTGEVTLPDASAGNEPFRLVAEDDGILLVYFGYTSCPDVCPTTLSDVRVALEDLGDDADRVDLAMATVDPERDTGEVLTTYLDHFIDGAHALRTTDDDALRAAADAFGVSYSVTPAEDGGEPEVAHTGSLFAVDDEGRIVVTWPFGTRPDDYAHDLEVLLGRY